MDLGPFVLSRMPRIVFGEGSVTRVPELVRSFGRRALVVTGRRSFRESRHWDAFVRGMSAGDASLETCAIDDEPSPAVVDEVVRGFGGQAIEVVVAVGGGSALDAGKAIAGLLPHGASVMDFLEGVGRGRVYTGPALPFVAVPTTAGTGSEATKNAVLSERRRGGFKKSFRHESLVPCYAVVDPGLLATCPRDLVAADGMDALTQLIESFVSSRANPMTDALAWSGLEAARDGLWQWYDGTDPERGRARMAYAALVSGMTLAQVGLGAVHGLASPLGAFFPIPHGVVCGTLLASATAANVQALEARAPAAPALAKYARVGALLSGRPDAGPDALVALLEDWTRRLELPRLGSYGVGDPDLDAVVADSRGGSMKTNPIELTDSEVRDILLRRL